MAYSRIPHRVVVTGLGAVSPLGNSVADTWGAMKDGKSGIGPITLFDAAKFDSKIASEVKGFDPEAWMDRKESRRMDRFAQFAVSAAVQAVADAKLDMDKTDRERVGVIVGSGIGGFTTMAEQHETLITRGPGRVSPFIIPMLIINMASGLVSIRFGAKGPNSSVVTACASGNHAIGDAFKIVQRGDADVMLAGGAEAAITAFAFAGFCNMGALSTRNADGPKASSPFDKKRDGFVMGEGSVILILESETHARTRGARILAEIAGYGMSGDAHHMTAPDPDGSGAILAMKRAIDDAGLKPADIDYVNAHGTSTQLNDKAETAGIKRVFGDHARKAAISSTKSMTGHMLGAAGAIEAMASVMAITEGFVPPTINYEDPDPDCDLDYTPNKGRKMEINNVMSNSFGFGGHNAVLVFRKWANTAAS